MRGARVGTVTGKSHAALCFFSQIYRFDEHRGALPDSQPLTLGAEPLCAMVSLYSSAEVGVECQKTCKLCPICATGTIKCLVSSSLSPLRHDAFGRSCRGRGRRRDRRPSSLTQNNNLDPVLIVLDHVFVAVKQTGNHLSERARVGCRRARPGRSASSSPLRIRST